MYDEFLDKKVEVEYGKMNPSTFPRMDWIRKKEHEIMKVVLSHDNGISHQTLAKIVRLDRKNLRPYMKRLKSKNLVTRESGKQGKYYPTTKAHRGISISADLLSDFFVSRILLNERFIVDSPYFKEKITDDDDYSELENALFNFSNKFGGFITYILIEAMNPANSNNIIGNTKNTDEENDLIVQSWIDDVISSMRPALLTCLKESVYPFLNSISEGCQNPDGTFNHERAFEFFINYNHKRPYYTLSDSIISELMRTYSKLYPNLSNILKKTISQLPRLVDRDIEQMEYTEQRFKQQEVCKHDYKPISNMKLLSIPKYAYTLHCRKCHKSIQTAF
jgi:predicted transcriptional regulator